MGIDSEEIAEVLFLPGINPDPSRDVILHFTLLFFKNSDMYKLAVSDDLSSHMYVFEFIFYRNDTLMSSSLNVKIKGNV